MRTPRGYQQVLLAVLALALLGYAAVRAFHDTPGRDQAAPGPADSTDPGDADPTGSPAPGLATASPSHSVPAHPGPASARPTSRASTPGSTAPAPVTYRVRNDDLCGYIDFAPVNDLSSPLGIPSVASERIDKSQSIVYVCIGSSGRVSIKDVDVVDYHDAAKASAAYAETKSYTPPGSKHIDGAGTDAYGYVWDSTSYRVVALASNITFRITLTPKTTPAPSTDQLGAAAIAVTRATITKLGR
jgi:hypothetical protein